MAALARNPELIAPTSSLRIAWLQAHREWGPGLHEDGFGLSANDDINSVEGFAAWVGQLGDQSDPAMPAGAGREHSTYRWIVEGNEVLGGIALRHEFTEFVARMGHIGYGIRPSARRRGLATWALGRMLEQAKLLGIERALVVCEAANLASAKAIERNGGVLEAAPGAGHADELRYWIPVGARLFTSEDYQ